MSGLIILSQLRGIVSLLTISQVKCLRCHLPDSPSLQLHSSEYLQTLLLWGERCGISTVVRWKVWYLYRCEVEGVVSLLLWGERCGISTVDIYRPDWGCWLHSGPASPLVRPGPVWGVPGHPRDTGTLNSRTHTAHSCTNTRVATQISSN